MKIVAIALAGVLGLAALQPARAQFAVPSGPFADSQALKNWWVAHQPGNQGVEVFYNGRKIYSRSGFGPGISVQYFLCGATNDVRRQCGSLEDASGTVDWLVDRLDTSNGAMPAVADTDVYLDGTLYRAASVPGAWSEYHLRTCLGDPSVYAPGGIRYYIFDFMSPGFSPAYQGSCFF